MKLKQENFNYYGLDIEKSANFLGENVKYLGTFCIKGNYLPSAMFYSPNTDKDKGHKHYPYLFIQNSVLYVGALDPEEFEKEKFQSGLFCQNCNSVIYSVNRHDYRFCNCEDEKNKISIDGGKDYTKIGYRENSKYNLVEIDFKTGNIKIKE